MTEHDDLPLPDYDHLPVGSLISRVRSLDAAQLATVLSYEREHADRIQVVQALTHRLEQLNDGVEPSSGDPEAAQPEAAPAPAGGSPVSQATSGPPMNPPSHGDPTNPAQPRSTG